MQNEYGWEVPDGYYARGYADALAGQSPVSPLVLAYEAGYMAAFRTWGGHHPMLDQVHLAVRRMRAGKSCLTYERKARRL